MYAKPFLKRVLVVMLALSLLVPQSLLTVQADSSTIYVHDSKAYDNPAFSEPLRKQNREDFSDGTKETPVSTLLAGSSSKNGEYCTTNEAVSNRIREFLVKREENYSIKVRLKIGNVKDSEKEDTLTKLMSSLSRYGQLRKTEVRTSAVPGAKQ